MGKKYYAVKAGKETGIYTSWDACKAQVHGYAGALYKSFPSLAEANRYMEDTSEAKISMAAKQDNQYRIYVDGSYCQNAYGWGFAAYLGERLVHTANGRGADEANIHNIAGELEATIQAVQWAKAKDIQPITIYHDYIGISEWAEKRWKTNNEITKAYALFMQQHLTWVHFQKVAGHTGVEGNELADQLAKQALGIQ